MDYKNMGDLISELRKQQNMTQKDLADKLNITDKAISKWERGISCPDINTVPKLAEILNISSEELLNFQKDISQVAAHNYDLTFSQKVNQISTLVLKAVGMAMGIAVLVLSVLGNIQINPAITMLAIGIACIGVVQFQNK